MIQQILQSIHGVGTYAAVALILFVAAFVAMVYRTMRMNNHDIEVLRRLPLDLDEPAEPGGAPRHD